MRQPRNKNKNILIILFIQFILFLLWIAYEFIPNEPKDDGLRYDFSDASATARTGASWQKYSERWHRIDTRCHLSTSDYSYI